jgi:hypothetical protein
VDERIRLDDPFGPGATRPIPGEPNGIALQPLHGIEQCLASVVLGAVFALMAFPTMLMIHILGEVQFRGWPRALILLGAALGSLGGLFVLASSVIGLIFGILGMSAARRSGRSIALGFAGVLLNGLDLLMWLGAMIGWVGTVGECI